MKGSPMLLTWFLARLRPRYVWSPALDLGNPKRVYYFRQEVKNASLEKLQKSLPLLLDLEASLKRGREEISTLQTKVIELSSLFS